MASKRQQQVSELVKRHFSTVLLQEGSYIYDQALVTVTNVVVSSDLRHAKIYLSVYNREDKSNVILEMEEEKSRLKSLFGNSIRKHIKRVPEIDFYLDETLDEMYRLNQLFDNINHKK
ncbi:30S ribosome-binding factor RbfA [Membranihabitans maritimus]|uniref:30S ribosome-binding factor RbfA n=1 Tax=Membranihabitans maritimus TaxID=2904244 RepID=UPI001F0026B7|nr:30S ribosome-binding factor RbfA [Membranihabitans maritimus]